MTFPPLKTKVEISWMDIVTSGGWTDIGDMASTDSPHPCTSIGFLSHVDTDYIVVSNTYSYNNPDQYNGHIAIPIGCIRNITEL